MSPDPRATRRGGGFCPSPPPAFRSPPCTAGGLRAPAFPGPGRKSASFLINKGLFLKRWLEHSKFLPHSRRMRQHGPTDRPERLKRKRFTGTSRSPRPSVHLRPRGRGHGEHPGPWMGHQAPPGPRPRRSHTASSGSLIRDSDLPCPTPSTSVVFSRPRPRHGSRAVCGLISSQTTPAVHTSPVASMLPP